MARTTGTLIAGLLCTIAGLFPAIAMKLLNFVGIYGTILAPVGAIILVDVYLADRVGIERNWAEARGKSFNLAVLLAWIVPLALFAYFRRYVFESYLTLPVFLLTGILYVVFAKLLNGRPGEARDSEASSFVRS